MNHAIMTQHLELAERHVLEGERHVTRQAELVAELERDGHDTDQARVLLGNFQALLALHIASRDRLRAWLAQQA